MSKRHRLKKPPPNRLGLWDVINNAAQSGWGPTIRTAAMVLVVFACVAAAIYLVALATGPLGAAVGTAVPAIIKLLR